MTENGIEKQNFVNENTELRSQLKLLKEELASVVEKSEKDKKALFAQLENSQKIELVGRLAGFVANDFSQMLSVILGHAEIALSWIDSTHHLYESLQEIYKAAERSAELTRQLLIFSGRQRVSPKIQDLNVTLGAILKLLRRLVGSNIDLIWNPSQSPCMVYLDIAQINQVLANLCVNAGEAIKDAGIITISLDLVSISADDSNETEEIAPGDYVVIKVVDTGCGMNQQAVENLFKPFYTTKEYGSGLGLPVVNEIVRQNRGFIKVFSEIGRGTEFKLHFPRCADEMLNETESFEMVNKGNSPTILVVDDDVALLGMVRKMLQSMGYNVLSVDKPSAALSLIKTNPIKIDLLLTDLVMPEMNGRTLAREIEELRPDIACLFMSGYGEKIVAHHGLMNSNVNFVAKPFTRENLSAALTRVLGGSQSASKG